MSYRLLRLVLVLAALAALGGFAYTFADFWKNREEYMSRFDLDGFRKGFRAAPPPEQSHIRNYDEYAACHKLEVTGKAPVVEGPGGTVEVKPRMRVAPEDVEVRYIQFNESNPAASLAYLQATSEDGPTASTPGSTPARPAPNRPPRSVPASQGPAFTSPAGDLYAVGDSFTIPKERDAKITVSAIRLQEVDLSVEGQDQGLTLKVRNYEVETDSVRPAGPAGARVPVVVHPERTVEVEGQPGVYDVGTEDLAALAGMPEDEIYAAVQVAPERDATGKILGLHVRSVRKDSVFSRQGLQDDDVILEVNGRPATDRAELIRWLRAQQDLRELRVSIERFGSVRTFTYRLPQRK